MGDFPRNVERNGRVIWIEMEPGVFMSPPPFNQVDLHVSREFMRYGERMQAGGDLLRYIGVSWRQFIEDLNESRLNFGRGRERLRVR